MLIPPVISDKTELRRRYERGEWLEVARAGRAFPVQRQSDAEVLQLAGSAARRLWHLPQAVANLHAAVSLDPWNGPAWRELGMAWFDLRQLPIAEYAWSRAALLGAGDVTMERAREVVRVVTGRKPLDRSVILERIRSFDHGRLPHVDHIIPDDAVRLPVLFSLGPERRIQAALTIDDAPNPQTTPIILETLRTRSVQATFFVVGQFVAQYPEFVARMVDQGHDVFAHGWSHTPFTHLDESAIYAELDKTETELRRLRPTPSPYPLRLPGGAGWTDARVHAALRAWSSDTVIVHWSIDPRDYRLPTINAIGDDLDLDANIRIMETVHDPLFSAPILVCHDSLVSGVTKPPGLFQKFFGGLIDMFHDLGMTFSGLGHQYPQQEISSAGTPAS